MNKILMIFDLPSNITINEIEVSQQIAFNILKWKFMKEPILTHSNFNKKFKLYMDILDIGLEAILI